MEAVTPIHHFIFELIMSLKCGTPLAVSIVDSLEGEGEFYREMGIWWLCLQNKVDAEPPFSTDHRKVLAEILESGLNGGSILLHLEDLCGEIHDLQEQQIQNYLEKLPFRLMLPLVCFFFPSILVLIFGPLFGQLFQEVLY